MPSEPPSSNFKTKVRIAAYPCEERGGVIWAYMGPPELQPAFPELEWTQVPEAHRFSSRHVQECNWLQALEGGFDTSHLSFLHRGTESTEGKSVSLPTLYDVVGTDFGFVAGSGRVREGGETFWSANVMLMPFHKLIGFASFADMPVGAHAWVPIDDETCMAWSVNYRADRPLNEAELARCTSWRGMHAETVAGTDHAVHNRDNDYRVDRALQASGRSFTGIFGVGNQDAAIQESIGPISDRTREHLGTTDVIIIKLRQLLLRQLRALASGAAPTGLDPSAWRVRSTSFTLSPGESFEASVRERVKAREKMV